MSNPFPVMHGSMWKEPQTLEECTDTDCNKCAYRHLLYLNGVTKTSLSCEHKDALIYAMLEV